MASSAHPIYAVDLAVIGLYLFGIAVFGAYFFRRSRTVEGFTLGQRSLPGWALGLSIMGTFLSSNTFLGYPGKAYEANWAMFVFSLTLPIAAVLSSRFFIPLYRRRLQTTAYQHLEDRFGPLARGYSGVSLILLQLGRIATVLYLVSLPVGRLMGWNATATILVLGALTISYTILGGISAVVWTDVIQAVVLMAGAIFCMVLILARTPGGAETVMEAAREADKFSFGGWDLNLAIEGFWVVLLYGIVENIKNFGVDQNYVQRFLSAPSDREARKSLWLGSLIYLPVSAVFFFIGTALFGFYGGSARPADFPAQSDEVFPYFIVHELPPGATGLMIAAILAAAMSTLDSSINASATVWTVDFHQRYLRPGAGDHALLNVARRATLLVGLLGTGSALLMTRVTGNAIDIWWQISAVFGGGMLGLFLLGLLVPRATRQSAFLGVIAGVAAIAWGTFAHGLEGPLRFLNFPLHKFLVGFVGTFAILLVGWAHALWLARRAPR